MDTHRIRACRLLATLILTAIASIADAGNALVRIERHNEPGRNDLIAAGVDLVAETNDVWIAVGDAKRIAAAASRFELAAEVISDPVPHGTLALVGTRDPATATDMSVCGEVIDRGHGWQLVVGPDPLAPACTGSPLWFVRSLDLEPLRPNVSAPSRWSGLADGRTAITADPLVQEITDLVDVDLAMSHWAALSESPTWTTRYSLSQGCVDATDAVYGLFSSLGLDAQYQHHTSGYADNVIGTLPGSVNPDEVYIAIGHIDDLPDSGPAPGADDNASGTAMVTAAAEAMACYRFESTVKFIAVTGEEQGLRGSDYYADAAAAQGENIQAVLNADMIGWQGDGQPAVEDLDVIYNSNSAWLVQAMIESAAEYGTGMPINALDCPGMGYSDHAPFWANGFSAVCGITDDENLCGSGGNYPYYHQSTDTIANCGNGAPAFESAAIRTYVATLAHLAQPIARVVETPLDLDAQPDGDNRVALSWTPQGSASTFLIYRAPGGCSQPGPWSLIGETELSSFVDTSASGGIPLAYAVAGADPGGCVSAPTACVETTTTGACTEPPVFAGVELVSNAATSNCRLIVDWSPPQQLWCGGPATFNVYRSEVSNFEPGSDNRIGTGVVATTFTDDDVIDSVAYHYIVRAVDQANGIEEANTVEASSHPTGPFTIGTWSDDAGDTGDPAMVAQAPWAVVPGAGVSGAAYATGHYPSDTCAALTAPPLVLDADPQLEFWSRYDIEDGWDKGELQISTDGGSTWSRVPMIYPGSSDHTNDACGLGTGTFFTGIASSYSSFTAELSDWGGQEVVLRWLFSSDGAVEEDGWWIDDVSITDVAVPGTCSGADVIFVDGFESGGTGAWSP